VERGEQRRKVFLSYRSSDQAVVGEFAERLRRDGVESVAQAAFGQRHQRLRPPVDQIASSICDNPEAARKIAVNAVRSARASA
jgi:hypothetical protein